MRKTSKESNKTLKIILIIGVVIIAAIVGFVMMFGDFIPPISQTGLAMNNCKQRIQEYAIEHNALPAKLSDTKEIKGSFNSNVDGWGNDIIFSADSNGIVTLISYGKDNKPGGTGKNEDLVGTYQSRLMNGGWAAPTADWIKDPFKGLRKPRRL